MSEFLKTKFNSKILDKQEKKIETYIVYVNRCRIEITIDENTHSLTVYYVDFNITYSYRWRPFSSDKTFKEFIGQPEDIHYFLNKLGIVKDEFSLSKSKRELYSYSLRNFHYGLSKKERSEWLSRINELNEETLFYEGDGDINFWAYTEGGGYIDTEDMNCKVCDYSYQNLIIINGLIKVMEQIQKEILKKDKDE